MDLQREQLVRELPPLWRLESFTVAAPDGKAGESAGDGPVVQFFTAGIGLTVATYVIDSQRGPFTLLRQVAESGLKKTLSGLVKSVRRDGGWVVRLGIQNGYAMDAIGQPMDRFPGRTAVLGSPEAVKLLEELDTSVTRQQEAAAEQARRQQEGLDRQLAVVKAEAQRMVADRALIDQRAAALAEFKRQLLEGERTVRIATLEAALNGKDASLRAMAFSAAFANRDAVVANLALRAFLAQKKTLPVQLFATRENKDSEFVLNNLGPLSLN
ncbi:MAG: hypothetical protein WCK65_03445, partial [Rhodospirillaceae bacterium]